MECVGENVSEKVAWVVQYYDGVVNKMVWRKGRGQGCLDLHNGGFLSGRYCHLLQLSLVISPREIHVFWSPLWISPVAFAWG